MLKGKQRGSTENQRFEQEETERNERDRLQAEKDAEKQAEAEARENRITENARDKVFTQVLNSYRRKEDP